MPTDKKRKIRNTIAITLALVMMLLGVAGLDSSNVNPSYGADENVVDNPNYVEKQIIVVFNDDVDRASAADIVAFALSEELIAEKKKSSGSIKAIRDELRLTKVKTDDNMMLISLKTDVDEKAAASEISKNPDVVSAQPNYIYTLSEGSSMDADYDDGEWYLDFIGAGKARKLLDKKKTDGKVTVAALDTGVATNHEALKDVDVVSTNIEEAFDGHGTEMAGIIAKTAGKSNIKLLAIDIFNENSVYGGKSVTTTADVIAGIDYACRHDARIVTMAFGRHGFDKALEKKINWAAKEDVLLIAAAGDNGNEQAWYPADYDNCLSCINTVKYGKASDDSNRNESSNYGESKAISAPGTLISSADLKGGYSDKSGSDYSAAITAGTAAMVMCADPDISAEKTKDILIDTAKDLGKTGFDIYTANGNVNAYEAVTKALKRKD